MVRIIMAKKTHPLKAAREGRRMTLQQAADLLRVRVSTLWNWEQPTKYPNSKNLIKIERIFGITPNEMLRISLVGKRR